MRTDCTRDNQATRLPNASHLGFDLWKAKRGNWIRYAQARTEGQFGRVLGRVHCEGKTYVEIIALLGAADCPAVRWIDPADVLQCLAVPPRSIFEFICGEWSQPADILARVERGFLSDSYVETKSPLGSPAKEQSK